MLEKLIPGKSGENPAKDEQDPLGAKKVQPSNEGAGPLLQRDYWGRIHGTSLSPEAAAELIKRNFESLSDPSIASFQRVSDAPDALAIGDEFEIHIVLSGPCRVRVSHLSPLSLTLRTLEGHPEAGRITFGISEGPAGLEFRIRSRARASDAAHLVGYVFLGHAMQTKLWVRFVENAVRLCGGTLVEEVHVEESAVEDRLSDDAGHEFPTFQAKASA